MGTQTLVVFTISQCVTYSFFYNYLVHIPRFNESQGATSDLLIWTTRAAHDYYFLCIFDTCANKWEFVPFSFISSSLQLISSIYLFYSMIQNYWLWEKFCHHLLRSTSCAFSVVSLSWNGPSTRCHKIVLVTKNWSVCAARELSRE